MKRKNEISSNGELEIQFLTSKEPNNGRMLWVVDIFLNKSNINDTIFKGGWNCLNFKLTQWQLENENYYYLPIEGESILINKTNYAIIKLKYQGVSTIRFEGNIFYDNSLIELYNEAIEITNLETGETKTIDWKSQGKLKSIEINDLAQLEIRYIDFDIDELKYMSQIALDILDDEVNVPISKSKQIQKILKSVLEENKAIKLETQQIDDLYSIFELGSLWDEYVSYKGEIIGCKMLDKLERIKFGKLETIEI